MITFLISAVVASIFAPVSDSSAQTVTVENRATGYFVSVTSPDMVELSVDATPTGSTVVSDASTINVVTNAPGGYKLYLSAKDNELKATNSDGTTNSSITQTFKPVASTSLTNNTWGYSLDSGSSKNWSPVPSVPLPEINGGNTTESYMEAKGASLISESNTSNYPNGTDIDIYYGINADTTMPSGTYTTTVTYTAFAEGIPAIYTMQGFTTQECANMATDTQTELLDTRNNKTYTIVKARDGNCWMAENLSIYNTTISSEDSNLPEGTTITLPESTIWDNNNTTDMLIHVADGTGQYADKTGEYYGEVYYNWCASIGEENCGKYNVAGTTINQSICPKGWRLPINGDANTDKSYAKLLNSYGITTGAQLLAQTSLGFTKYYGRWGWGNTSEYDQGSNGYFWASTVYSGTDGYNLYYKDTNTVLQSSHTKGNGMPIRCVQENRTLSDVAYMQDVYDQICVNTATGTTAQLLDRRGYGNGGNNKTTKYGVVKAKDGNCWMTDNLNLYNVTISYAYSDFASGTFTIPASSKWGSSASDSAQRVYVATESGVAGQNYYNWCSAIAVANCSSITTQQNTSICPKNWQLPKNLQTFTDLMSSYSITSGAQLIKVSELGYKYYYGYYKYDTQTIADSGSGGYMWTKSFYSTTHISTFGYFNGKNGFSDYSRKGTGVPLRCILR